MNKYIHKWIRDQINETERNWFKVMLCYAMLCYVMLRFKVSYFNSNKNTLVI